MSALSNDTPLGGARDNEPHRCPEIDGVAVCRTGRRPLLRCHHQANLEERNDWIPGNPKTPRDRASCLSASIDQLSRAGRHGSCDDNAGSCVTVCGTQAKAGKFGTQAGTQSPILGKEKGKRAHASSGWDAIVEAMGLVRAGPISGTKHLGSKEHTTRAAATWMRFDSMFHCTGTSETLKGTGETDSSAPSSPVLPPCASSRVDRTKVHCPIRFKAHGERMESGLGKMRPPLV